METFLTVVVILAMVALGAFLIHRLNNPHTSASRPSRSSRSLPTVRGPGPSARSRLPVAPRRARRAMAEPSATAAVGDSGPGPGPAHKGSESSCSPSSSWRTPAVSQCFPAPRCCGWRRPPSARGRSTARGGRRSRDLGEPTVRPGHRTDGPARHHLPRRPRHAATGTRPRAIWSSTGHTVRIDWSAVGDRTMIVTRGAQDHFLFLVIPPQAAPAPAHAAMAMAVRDDNAASAGHVLAAAGVTPADRTVVASRSPG